MAEANSFRNGSQHSASMQFGDFHVTAATFPASLSLALHRHDRAACSVVLNGALEKEFSGKSVHAPENGVVTMPPHERHKALFARQGAHMLIIEPVSLDEETLRPCVDLFQRIITFRDVRITNTAWRVCREILDPDDFSSLAVEGLVLELLACAARRLGEQQDSSTSPPWLEQARAYLHEQFTADVRIGELAARIGVHPVHLARVFREHLGRSPGEYIRQLRIEWAAAQLTATQNTIGDISQKAGFADQSHFTRVFKEYVGVTPGQYRTGDRRRRNAGHHSRRG